MLRHRSIRTRIIVLVLVPVIALVGLYTIVLNLTLGNLLSLRNEAAVHQLLVLPVASVQGAVGKERTYALQYLAKPNRANLRLLLAREHKSDIAIRKFHGTVDRVLKTGPVPKERQALLAWQATLGRISSLRTAVLSREYTIPGAASTYSFVLDQGDDVLNQALVPVLTGPLGVQATDLLNLAKAAQADGEESDIVRAGLIAHSLDPVGRTLVNQLAVQRQNDWDQNLADLDPNLRGYFKTQIPKRVTAQIESMENIVVSGAPTTDLVSLPAWNYAQARYQKGFLKALLISAAVLAKEATAQADSLVLRLVLIAAIGLIAIGVAVAVAVVLGRGLARQLGDLRESAVALSAEQLPEAIGRLRAGEDVDIAAAVPRLPAGEDEIGQVRQAFNVAARTAISAAVDEVNIRRGVNDVFRNLARRNQSLLTRQLQLLDAMERRVHDPEELADLFRVDHLTTRMRRHAEGLLIVAGGSSGRTWREPVPIVDVMRAAVAEVEDYTRIRVTSHTGAALAGHAVADIIHLLAELVENAATFSPANTPVRIDGDRVGKGVVIEIEDRGLGIGEAQLAEINATLENPPLFDLSGSDQLGLFITGQLAKRHDVQVSLRPSLYGGVVAMVMIPLSLIIDIDESQEMPAIASIRELGGRPAAELPRAVPELAAGELAGTGPRELALEAPSGGEDLPVRLPAAGPDLPARLPAAPAEITAQTTDLPARPAASGVTIGADADIALPDSRAVQSPAARTDHFAANGSGAWPMLGVFPATGLGDPSLADHTFPGDVDPDDFGSDYDTVTMEPAGHPALPTRQPAGYSSDRTADVRHADQPDHQPVHSGLIWNDNGLGPISQESSTTVSADQIDLDGLPMRVRQASLAPQLLQQPAAVSADQSAASPAEPAGPSPEAARSTFAALQRGWERGRSESGETDPGPAEANAREPGQGTDGPQADTTGGSR